MVTISFQYTSKLPQVLSLTNLGCGILSCDSAVLFLVILKQVLYGLSPGAKCCFDFQVVLLH